MGRGSKNLSKGNRKLALMHESESLHYRMYKAGRTWLFAGIATFSLGAVLLGSQVTASAAEDPTQTTAPATTPEAGTGAGQAADTNGGVAAQQQPAATQTQPAGETVANDTTPAPSTVDDEAATPATGDQGTATAPADTTGDSASTTTPETTKAPEAKTGHVAKTTDTTLGVVTGNNGNNVNAPAGATDEPDTSGALIKTNLFGNGLSNDSENSATAGVGADSVKNANNANDRQADGKGTYGNVYGEGKTVPDGGSIIDPNDSTKVMGAGDGIKVINDVFDSKIDSSVVDDNSETHGITDQINDQGAISSDSQNLQNNAVRGGVIYSESESTGIDFSIAGEGQNGVNIGIPDNLKDSLKVGTWTVQDQNHVGIIIADKITGEQFQIVDSDYGDQGPYKDQYAKGKDVDGKAIYTAIVNGGVMQTVAQAVTQGISGLSNFAGGVGQALIGNGTSLITPALKNVLENPLDPGNILNAGSIVNDAKDLGQRLEGTVTQDGSGIGVSDIIATLVDLLPLLGVNTQDFQDAYQGQIKQVNDMINQLNEYGDKLMQDGVAITGLTDATIKTTTVDGVSHKYIEVLSGSDLSTARAVTNMFKSYIEGWAQGIADALDSVFTGNQEIKQDDAQNDPYNLYRFNGKTPQGILNEAIDAAEGNGLGGLLLQIGQPIVEGALNALSGINNDIVQPIITEVDTWVTNSLGDVISQAIDGAVGGETQIVAVPTSWTDPMFVNEAAGQNALPGQFVEETFDTKSKIYNVTNTSTTRIAYQNVDKTQLVQLIADHTDDTNIPTEVHTLAETVKNDPDASQYDVDQAIIQMGAHIKTTDNIAAINLATLTVPAGQTKEAVLATQAPTVLTASPLAAATPDEAKALNDAIALVKPTLTANDFNFNDDGTYVLSPSGVAKINEALQNNGADFSLVDKPQGLVKDANAAVVIYQVQPVDDSGNALADPSDDLSGQPGNAIDLSNAPETIKVGDITWNRTKTLPMIPENGGLVKVTYTKDGGNSSTPDPGDKTDSTYALDAIDESGTVLPGSLHTGLKGNAGEPVDATQLAQTYTDANGKVWTKPAAESLGSYFIKDGATIHVLYTDEDATTPDTPTPGKGSIIYLGNGLWGLDDGNGHTATFDPSKLGSNGNGQPIIIIDSGNTNYYPNGGGSDSNGSGTPGTGTTGTDNGTNGPITVILPGQNSSDGGTKVTKNSDGSLTFTFPDGTTQTVQPGDTDSKTDPAGGSFKVNPDGTITFTDAGGNSYTIDPNNKTNGLTQPGSKITNVVLPGQDTDGKNGSDQTLMIEKAPNGDIILHLPDGSTQTITKENPGTLPDGSSIVVNPDGTITITDPSGKTQTIDPDKGETVPTGNNSSGQTTVTPVDTDGDGIADDFEIKVGTNPSAVDTDGDGDTDLQEVLNGTNPKDPNSNVKTPGNGSNGSGSGPINIYINGGSVSTDGTKGSGSTSTGSNGPTLIVLPGQSTGTKAIKNPDGSITFTFPDGNTQTVQPGDTTKPDANGGSFKVNPDGTLTYTDGDGNTFTLDPNNKASGTTQPGSKITNIVLPGKDGKDGKDAPDQTVMMERTPNGDIMLHFPDGTTQTVQPGQTGTTPGGSTFVVNPDGSITFTNPDGSETTVDPKNGTTTPIVINTGNNGGSSTSTPVDTDGDGIPDSFETKIGTNAAKTDSDNDGDTDFQEVLNHTNPLDPASNLKSLENGGKDASTGSSTSTTTNTTTINNVPGQDGGIKATKNPDGSITFTFPDGSTQNVKTGDSTKPDANGGSFTVNPDGTITFTDGNGNSYTIDPNKGTTINPITVNVPGQDGGTQVTKNPDGSITFTFPDGSTQTVQPGDATKPDANGGSFKVNSDGTITVTNPDGTSYTFDPNNGQGTPTQPGSKSTVIVLPGKDGATNVVTAEKTPNGDIILHLPDGSTQTVEPGKNGTLPDGTKYTYNEDGSFTFTTPDGKTTTIDPEKGTSDLTASTSTITNTTTDNGGTVNNTTNNYYGTDGPVSATIKLPAGKDGNSYTITYTKNPDGTATLTTPDGKTVTVKPGATGTLPNGGTYTVLPDGSLSITNPDGTTTVVNPGGGTDGLTTNNGGSTTPTDTNNNNGTDTDGDGVPDGLEGKLGTNADNKDTDGDGDTDLQELMNGTNPKDPASNLASLKNGGSTTNNNGGSPITINLPGQNGGINVTKNPDGSFTFTFPDGSQETVQPGDDSSHVNPAGGSFVVNPDGTITFTGKDGSTYTIDPSKIGGQPTAGDSKTTVIVIPGQTGKDGQPGASTIVTVEKTSDGSTIIHLPDGTTREVNPGDQGELPNGTKYVVNKDGSITFTNPDGSTSTVDPKDGNQGNIFINPNGGNNQGTDKTTVVFVPGKDGNGGIIINVTKKPNGDIVITNPDGSSQTVQPGDEGNLPNGATFKVNEDGSITITNPDGSHFTIDPNKGGATTPTGNIYNYGDTYNYYGTDGSAATTITLPAGTDGKSYTITYTKNPDGSFTLTTPTGSQTVKPGETGKLPNGGSFIVNPDGSLKITNPDGSTSIVNPGKTGSTGNIYITNNYGGQEGTQGKNTIVLVPGKDGTSTVVNVTGNPDGTVTINTPGGSVTGKPGDKGTLPGGGDYVINPNGTVTITLPGGAPFTIDPNKGSNGPATVVINVPSQGGSTTTPAGNYSVTDNGNGTLTITVPTGESVSGKTGDTGSLPGGGSYTIGDTSVVITLPNGQQITIPFNGNGGSGTPTDNNSGNPTNGGNPTTGTNTTTPTSDTGTAVTTPSNGNTGNNGGSGANDISTTAGEGTATGANGTGADQGGIVTGGDAGTATGTQAGTANQGGAIVQDTSAGAAASGEVNGNKQAADKSALPQTDEKPTEGIAALGLLGGLVSLLGLAGAKRRRKDI